LKRESGTHRLTGGSSQQRLTGSGGLARRWREEVISGVDHRDVIGRVREDAGWSVHFAVMTILSAGIAVLGLLLSSPAIVIGAMLISPLMGPIVGAGFAIATFDAAEIRRALWALAAGVVLAIFFCAAIVLLSPIQTVTSEIASRTRPNLFDLLVALLAGLAGTYAVIRGRHGAIVGVAIATALMPPLAVMGFGLATANWAVLSGSSLLFFTNLMTIAAAAAVLARVYGFATDLSPHQTRLQLFMILGSLLVLAVPLGLSLKKIAWEAFATSEAKTTIAAVFGDKARVSQLDIAFGASPLQLDATVLTPKYRPGVEVQVAHALEQRLGEKVAVTIDQVRTSDGDTAALDLGNPSAAASAKVGSRIARELAIIAGVDPDQVLLDTGHNIAEVRAAGLPGADLATYRAIEARVSASEPNWKVVVIPPPLALPSIQDADSRDDAIATTIWAAQRLNLPVSLSGRSKDADAIEQRLRDAGVAVHRSSRGPLSLRWQTGSPGAD
jgi:uncharacterized hydrophobic protein (TIGR00271 family)